MWITVAKIALIAFIVVAVAIVVVTYVRKSRIRKAEGRTFEGYPRPSNPDLGHLRAGMPPNPLPDWVKDDDRFKHLHQDPPR